MKKRIRLLTNSEIDEYFRRAAETVREVRDQLAQISAIPVSLHGVKIRG